jgi:hypothetical protein
MSTLPSAHSRRRLSARSHDRAARDGALAFGAGCGSDRAHDRRDASAKGSTHTEVAYAFDAADKRELVAFSNNVFVGRVLRRTAAVRMRTSASSVEVPQTRFAVHVVKNIKGRLRGTVTVAQYGGPIEAVVVRDGRRRVERDVDVWEGDPLLKPGEQVLLATRRDPARGTHTIVAQPFADRRIRDQSQGDRLVREFTEARRARRTE